MPGGTGRIMGDTDPKQVVPPLEGPPEAIAEALRGYAREGIGHVQLVVDPITEASVAALAPALEALDRRLTAAPRWTGRAPRRASRAIVRVLASAPTAHSGSRPAGDPPMRPPTQWPSRPSTRPPGE